MFLPLISVLCLVVVSAAAVLPPTNSHAHDDGNTWYHEFSHPPTHYSDETLLGWYQLSSVGSPTWSSAYPVSSPVASSLPVAWVNALNAAVAAGTIPNIPQTTMGANGAPTYPPGFDPTGPKSIPGDIWNAPDGVFASSFDDGPTQSTPTLIQFLQAQNDSTTHFMIGTSILNNPSQFQLAFNAGHDIAVHTWTHPYMTTLSNMDVLGQLGWTMQIIHNSTAGGCPNSGGLLTVFGLTTVIWNHDTTDWAQSSTGPIESAMTGFLASPKHPGLIILEHELTDVTVNGFIQAYPMIQQNGWNFVSLAQAVGNGSSYMNAQSSTGNVVPLGILLANQTTSATQTRLRLP
ncbi:hypothetical protein BDZ97DRAFT_1752812 [Flammula alnicola]|nr:hypothetical protein BDZ97DRAFT_1752812 [Flammula alnicola]